MNMCIICLNVKFSVVLFFSNWQHITSLPHKGAMSVVSKYMVISIYQNKWAITVSHCFFIRPCGVYCQLKLSGVNLWPELYQMVGPGWRPRHRPCSNDND